MIWGHIIRQQKRVTLEHMKEGNKIHDIELGFPFMASAWLQSSSALIEQVLEKELCRDDTRVVLYEVVWLLKMPT